MFSDLSKAAPKLNRAFSLIELVVVIMVASLLLMIVVSAHALPRNRVYQITDVKNHRSILHAMISFAADNSDKLPNPGWGTSQKCWLYGTNLPPGGGGTFSNYVTAHAQQLISITNGQLFAYVQDPRAFMCPADNTDNRFFWLRNVYICSYMWNGAVNGYGALLNSTPSAYKLSQFRPDAILQWEGDERSPVNFNDGAVRPSEGISQRHGTNNLTFGMFGGGVATMTTTTFYTQVASSSANRLWCNPGSPIGR